MVFHPFSGYSSPSETGLYYLQSRYYDPVVGRFLNADAFASTGQGILGANMFSYCGNDPVDCSDPSGLWVIGSFGGSFGAGAGAGGNVGTIVLFDGDGNSAIVVIGFYGGSTPNASIEVDALLFSNADNIFEFILGDTVSFGGSMGTLSVDGFLGSDSKGDQLWGINVSFGLSAIPADVKGGIGYAYLEEILFCQGKPVPDNVRMDFFSALPAQYQRIIHEQLEIPYAPLNGQPSGGSGAAWHALAK